MPKNPPRGSCRISTEASCSLTPSSASADSTASSTLGALLSTSGIAASATRLLVARRSSRRCLGHLPLLEVGRTHHEQREHEVWDAGCATMAAVLGDRPGLATVLRREHHLDLPAGFQRRAAQARAQEVRLPV